MKDPLQARVDTLMAERKLDVLLLLGNTPEHPSFYYLVRGQKMEGAILVWKRGGKKLLVGSDMERDNAAKTGLEYLPYSKTPLARLMKRHAGDPAGLQIAKLMWALKKARAKGRMAIYGAVGLESAVGWLPKFKRECKAAGIALIAEKHPVLHRAREIKTEAEIERIREAGVGTQAAFTALRKRLAGCTAKGRTLMTAKGKPLTIGDLKREVRLTLSRHGLTEAVPSIIAQGEEGGVPHNAGTDSRKVVVGQPIIADIFPRGEFGYFFDMTRTFCPGKAPAKARKIYADVKEATLMAFEAFEPGIEAYELHMRVARRLAEKGYETPHTHPGTQVGFCHTLGHGLGLEVHEEPFTRATAPKVLEPGMVITIEPGLYYPSEKVATRIEDVAVVREGYLENLTDFPMELEVPLKG
jgi:Xaa-Pro aminopeptidase